MDFSTSPATWVAVAEAEAAPPTSAPGHAHPTSCLNCDTPLTDKYCAHCGQPAATHRLTMGHLLHDIPHSIWHVDKGIFYTLRELLLRPGPTLLGYLRGQRARHFAPVSLLLLVTGISSFLALKMDMIHMVVSSTAPAELRAAQVQGTEAMMHYMGWLYVATTPLVGLLVRRVLRRTGINLAEAMVVVLFITAASNALTMCAYPFYYWVSSPVGFQRVSLVSSLLMLVYQGWAYAQLLASTGRAALGRWWRGVFTATVAYGLVMLSGMVVMFATQWPAIKAGIVADAARRRALRPAPAMPQPAPRP